jgi:dolichol kinase
MSFSAASRSNHRETASSSRNRRAPVRDRTDPNGSGDEPDPFSYRAELGRKALHLFALVVPLGMAGLGTTTALLLLAPATALAVGADVLRAYSERFARGIRAVFGPLMRREELPPVGSGVVINGATSVLIGATLLTLFFPIDVAAGVFAMTMIADAAAALVGRRFGRHRWPGSSHTLEGSLAFVVAGGLVVGALPSLPVSVGLPGVIAAAAVEAAPLPLNDNIRVPLIGALVVTAGQLWFLGEIVQWGWIGFVLQ